MKKFSYSINSLLWWIMSVIVCRLSVWVGSFQEDVDLETMETSDRRTPCQPMESTHLRFCTYEVVDELWNSHISALTKREFSRRCWRTAWAWWSLYPLWSLRISGCCPNKWKQTGLAFPWACQCLMCCDTKVMASKWSIGCTECSDGTQIHGYLKTKQLATPQGQAKVELAMIFPLLSRVK